MSRDVRNPAKGRRLSKFDLVILFVSLGLIVAITALSTPLWKTNPKVTAVADNTASIKAHPKK